MSNKYKNLIRYGVISLVIGILIAAIVAIVVKTYFNGFTLNIFQKRLSNQMCFMFIVTYGVTSIFAAMSIQIGHAERLSEKLWQEQNRERAKSFNSDIKGVNLAGLIDDTQSKEFSTIFGERIKVGEDFGTAYITFKTLFLFALFITVTTSVVMIMMMLSLK